MLLLLPSVDGNSVQQTSGDLESRPDDNWEGKIRVLGNCYNVGGREVTIEFDAE